MSQFYQRTGGSRHAAPGKLAVDILELAERPSHCAGAFCGLGNPAPFRRMDRIRRPPPLSAARSAPPGASHGGARRYGPGGEGAAELAAPLKIYWLEIGIRIEREQEFLGAIEEMLRPTATAPR